MTKRKTLEEAQSAGNPHERFDEEEVTSSAMPRRGSLLHSANTSTKSGSGRCGAVKATKMPTKYNTKQTAKWKVVGKKVCLSPGDYSIDDIEAMLKAIQEVNEDRVPHKDNAVK